MRSATKRRLLKIVVERKGAVGSKLGDEASFAAQPAQVFRPGPRHYGPCGSRGAAIECPVGLEHNAARSVADPANKALQPDKVGIAVAAVNHEVLHRPLTREVPAE